MKAVVFRGVGDIRFEEVAEPRIQDPRDAILRITASAICDTDLHVVRETMGPMRPGTILGHEAVGIVEEVGPGVRNLTEGDRVVVPSTMSCGHCSYCRQGITSQCDQANPKGSQAGPCFFGGPESTGPVHGLQAERARIPFANSTLVKLPDEVEDDDAILLSDIFPTGYFAARLADVRPGRTVAVFGCGPVGLFAILSAYLMGAGRVLAVDREPDRLAMASHLGAETISFEDEDPLETIREWTGGVGVDRAIDAAGMSADGASQAFSWAMEAVAKAGTVAVVGEYPPDMGVLTLDRARRRNIRVHAGTCNHRTVIPELIRMVESGAIHPRTMLSQVEALENSVEAYRFFTRRSHGWIKVALSAGVPVR